VESFGGISAEVVQGGLVVGLRSDNKNDNLTTIENQHRDINHHES
jgi:hypothetical protein